MNSHHDDARQPRRRAIALAAAALAAACAGPAGAFEFETGKDDVQVRWDNTFRYNYGRRVDAQNALTIANPNWDDGDRNFAKGSSVTNRLDILSEFDAVFQRRHGVRLSAAGWYDQAYAGGFDNTSVATSNRLVNGRPGLGLSPYADRWFHGPSGEILDAFVFGGFDIGDIAVNLRAGQHTVNWGEALLGGGAIHGIAYAQAPLDQAKALATPGIEAKELYRPLPQLSATVQATPELSFAGQYYFGWDATRLPESGTYLAAQDPLLRGADSLVLAPGPTAATRAPHGTDVTPRDRGDWGLAARWSPEWLDGTVGLYWRNFSDKLPQLNLIATAPRSYFFSYGSDIDMYGVSLAKNLGGVSFGLDLNYRRNMPLLSEQAVVTAATRPGEGETGGARGSTWHGVFNAVGILGKTPLYDSAAVAGELTWNRWNSVSQGANLFKGRDTYRVAGIPGEPIDKVTKNYWGLAVNFTPTWLQVFPGADLSLPLSYSAGLKGNSAVSSGGNEGTGSWSAGLGLDLYNRYRFDLRLVDYFGKATPNAAGTAYSVFNGTQAGMTDRRFIAFTFKTTL